MFYEPSSKRLKLSLMPKIVNIFLPIIKHVLGAKRNRFLETVLLSAHNICFHREIRKKTN